MHFKEWDDYLDSMLRHVKFTPDRKRIRLEFEEHMEDMFDDYVSDGMSEDEAKNSVLENIGDAHDVGKLMNAAHNALIGWIWQGLKVCLAIAVLSGLLPIYSLATKFFVCVPNLIFGYHEQEDMPEVEWRIDLDETIEFDCHKLKFDELLKRQDGTMELRYRDIKNPLDRAYAYDTGFNLRFYMFTNENAESPEDAGGWGNGGYIDYRNLYLYGFPENSGKMIIEYKDENLYKGRHFRIEVDLPENGG